MARNGNQIMNNDLKLRKPYFEVVWTYRKDVGRDMGKHIFHWKSQGKTSSGMKKYINNVKEEILGNYPLAPWG